MKTALLIYRFLREGPNHDNSIWSEIIEKITQKASSLPFVYNFCKIIKTKIELFEEISVGWYGNFFFPQIQVYLNL